MERLRASLKGSERGRKGVAAFEGIVNFIPTLAGSMLCTLDVEYSTWANPNSEVVFFSAGGGCC